MQKIALWYHCKLSGEGIPDAESAHAIVSEQMEALKSSGLENAASEIYLGINGGYADGIILGQLAPEKAFISVHGYNATTELRTLEMLRRWLPKHQDWAVLYHHSKGVTQPKDEFHHHHRRVMQKACIENWRKCVGDLDMGFDAVGVNWVDPITRPVLPGRFFAGNFWWARASFLLELPPLPNNATDYNRDRFRAEGWIGSSKRRPRVMDYERPELYE